jgi:hypothetical protein
MTTTKYLIKHKQSFNLENEMIQWFLLLDDDIKQHIIDVYNNNSLGLAFWKYLSVAYHNAGHPLDWR